MSQVKELSTFSLTIIVATIILMSVLSGSTIQHSYAQQSSNSKQASLSSSSSPTNTTKESENQAFILKQMIKSGTTRSNTTQSNTTQSNTTQSNTSQTTTNFETAREQYLAAWNQTTFHSGHDTFIQEDSDKGYGVYVTHPPVFKPGETMVLYVEPVGYSFKPVIDEQGNTLNQMNLTADIIISGSNGTQLATIKDLPGALINSHNKNTEMHLTLKVTQSSLFPVGDYKIIYTVKDGSTGKSFQIVKPVKIANIVS